MNLTINELVCVLVIVLIYIYSSFSEKRSNKFLKILDKSQLLVLGWMICFHVFLVFFYIFVLYIKCFLVFNF